MATKRFILDENDVFIRFDEQNQRVLFLVQVSNDIEDGLRELREFPRIDKLDQATVIAELGTGLVAFFRAKHAEKFPVTNPLEDQPISPDELEPLTKFEEADALIAQLGDQSELGDLEAITALLEQANAEGDIVAERYLATRWPSLKDVFARRIKREKRLRGEIE